MTASIKRGRPSTGVPVLVRIPPDLLDQLDQAAAEEGNSRAEHLRQIIAYWFTPVD
jgi:metal-responsive CopG/Arc/MetJ family transcriptional regulator